MDFEFRAPAGERPDPVCLVAREVRTGRVLRQWRDEFSKRPPYRSDAKVLFVAFYASAELGCHLALGWPMPVHTLDLYVEFRERYKRPSDTGRPRTSRGAGLLRSGSHHGNPKGCRARLGHARRPVERIRSRAHPRLLR